MSGNTRNIILTDDNKQAWQGLIATMQTRKVNLNNLDELQAALRQFAMELIFHNAKTLKQLVQEDNILETFLDSETSLNEYLAKHSRNTEWADASILYYTLRQLGYDIEQTKLKNGKVEYQKTIMPRTSDKKSGLEIKLQNIDNVHWRLESDDNPGRGNCGYYTMAQQIMKDAADVIASESAKTTNLNALSKFIDSSKPEQTKAYDGERNQNKFAQLEATADSRYKKALDILNQYINSDLIEFYKIYSAKTKNHEKNGGAEQAKVTTLAKHFNTQISTKLGSGIDADEARSENRINREEMLHLLAHKCWLDPYAFKALEEKHQKHIDCTKATDNGMKIDEAISKFGIFAEQKNTNAQSQAKLTSNINCAQERRQADQQQSALAAPTAQAVF